MSRPITIELFGLKPTRTYNVCSVSVSSYITSTYTSSANFPTYLINFLENIKKGWLVMGRKKVSASNPRVNEQEIGSATIDRIVSRPTFEYFDKPQVGTRFFLFREKGEEITGQIVGPAVTNIRRNSSWPITLDTVAW